MRYFLAWLLLCLIWGSTWVAIKIGIADLPAIPVAGLRFAIAGVTLLALRAASGRSILPPPGSWRFLVLGGVLNFAIAYGLVFWGEQYVSAGLAALIGSLSPGFTILFAHFFIPAEALSWRKAVGIVLSVAGLALILSDQLHADRSAVWGSLALVLSTVAFASFNIWAKTNAKGLAPSLMAGWNMVFGCAPLLAIGAVYGNPLAYHWTVSAVVALFYMALAGSSLAFFLYYYLLRHIAVGSAVTNSLVTPVIAVVLDRMMLGETIRLVALLGGGMILCGITLVTGLRLPRPR